MRDPGFLLQEPEFARVLRHADTVMEETPAEARPALFDELPLEMFALLCARTPPEYPRLARWLPQMPPEATQIGATGTSGDRTMLDAAAFVRATVAAYERSGQPIGEVRMLDYGIGWARIARLFYKYTPTPRLFGTDAWPDNLRSAAEVGFSGALAAVPEIPERLPFEGAFDLVCAFSVLTHLSPPAAHAIVKAARARLSERGLLALTIRPQGFLELLAEPLQTRHRDELGRTGFSFSAESWSASGTYGEAIITLDYIRTHWTEFSVEETELSAADPYQLYVFLRPR